MISKKNKCIKYVIALLILASCSTTSKDFVTAHNEFRQENHQKDMQNIYAYSSFFVNDLEVIQQIIDNKKLSQSELRELRSLKKNYQKILEKNKYQIKLNPNQKYSKELVELVYQFNLPINISWDESNLNLIPSNLLTKKIDGFCSSLYDDSISSINKEISRNSGSILIIYSDQYSMIAKKIKLDNSKIYTVKYDSSDFQDFAAKVLGINLSNTRFKKISNLNPNQVMNFNPRSRSDIKQIIMLLNPQEFKAMIPALRYHGGNKFKYINFISSLEGLNNSLQLLDYEDSYTPISYFMSNKIQNEGMISIEDHLKYGVLSDWLLEKVLKQAGVQSATKNGATGIIFYNSSTCNKREIPLQKISSDLFSY